MKNSTKIKDFLENINDAKGIIENKDIILLTNTRNHTRNIGDLQIQFANEIEFFDEEEFEEILEGIKDAGFYVECYFNEISFINDVLSSKLDSKKIIVYNLARNGKKEGKKSLIPSFCDLLNIPYIGSNAFSISLCRNKYIFSKVLQANNISVPKTWLYLGGRKWANGKPCPGERIIVKPAYESASIGMDEKCIFTYTIDSEEYIEDLYIKNEKKALIIQEFISGYECEVPFFKCETPIVLDPVGISLNNEYVLDDNILTENISNTYSYDFYLLDSLLPDIIINEIKTTCHKTIEILGIENYGRIDFRVNHNGNIYITDIAASPYTTKHSSFAFLFEQYNLPYSSIFTTILASKFNSKLI